MNMKKGFTLIELMVVIAIIAVLSSIIMFSAAQYINKGKDSNVSGNLAVLIPAGEAFYNVGNTYANYCNSDAVINAWRQISKPVTILTCASDTNHAGLCCKVATDGSSWASCAQLFTNSAKAYCVDSRGIKRQISTTNCTGSIVVCPEN